jgi:gag-polypeptide of LTR copia-type/GAG-pre-integrase domain
MERTTFRGEKLIGRSNFIEWQYNASIYLEVTGFMPFIDGTEKPPNKDNYYDSNEKRPFSPELGVKYNDQLNEFNRNSRKALGALKSIISIDTAERFKDKHLASDLYNALKSTFGEAYFETLGRYYSKIITANSSSYPTIEQYTQAIQAAAIYLQEAKYPINEVFLVFTILKGLPSSFEHFISRKFEEYSTDINNAKLTTLIPELIAEESRLKSAIDLKGSYAKKPFKKSLNKGTIKPPFCRHCNKTGYIEDRCWKKYPELSKNKTTKSIPNTIMTSHLSNKEPSTETEFILDSGATEHYSPYLKWFTNYKPLDEEKYISIANGTKLRIYGKGSIPVTYQGHSILIEEVNYIPDISANLISSKELVKNGWDIIMGKNGSYITKPLVNLTINVIWRKMIYLIDIDVDFNALPDSYALSTKTEDINKIHQRLNHISEENIKKTISNTKGYDTTDLNKLDNCESCIAGK